MRLTIPREVKDYVCAHFRTCNEFLAVDLSTFPAIHEESLDMNFISYFSRHQTPVALPCNWIVRIDSHFIGGGRHFGTWEVADIGVMVIFRYKGRVIRSKLVFLQSKKLYSNPLKYTEESKYFRRFGLGRLLVPDEEHMQLIEDKILEFKNNSRYRAFKKNDEQQDAMGHFERRWNTKMYYLFYNPVCIPHRVKMPMECAPAFGSNVVGCRVVRKDHLDSALDSSKSGYSPSYKDVRDKLPSELDGLDFTAGWRLEVFVSELMLTCREGLVDDSPNFETLLALMNQKVRPISSAISITFDIRD